ncbi:NAD-dependent epimerase/dehydratase family protein [Acinetobacter baumannii]
MAKILVTGGAGYIGSHTCVELLEPCAVKLLYLITFQIAQKNL